MEDEVVVEIKMGIDQIQRQNKTKRDATEDPGGPSPVSYTHLTLPTTPYV